MTADTAAPVVLMTVHQIDGRHYVLAEDAHAAVTKAREQERAEVTAHAAAAWRAAVEAACSWDALLPRDASQAEVEMARRYVALVRTLIPPPEFAAALERVRSEAVAQEQERLMALIVALDDDQEFESDTGTDRTDRLLARIRAGGAA